MYVWNVWAWPMQPNRIHRVQRAHAGLKLNCYTEDEPTSATATAQPPVKPSEIPSASLSCTPGDSHEDPFGSDRQPLRRCQIPVVVQRRVCAASTTAMLMFERVATATFAHKRRLMS